MYARFSQRTADVAMVGLSIGPAGIAGIAFATVYWQLAIGFSAGLVGGTISQVSQAFGANRLDQLDLTVKQSLWMGFLIVIPIILGFVLFTEPLIQLLTSDSKTVQQGVSYLQMLAVGLLFLHPNLVASRTLAGADDTHLTMVIRASGAIVNIVLNFVFIYGLEMGVAGAALGTVIAEALVTTMFTVGFINGRLPFVGEFPIQLSVTRPYFHAELSRELVSLAFPLVIRWIARSISNFPLYAILAIFGPTVVAAYEVARRIRNLMNASGRGFSMAASSLVGQELGRNNGQEAKNYGKDLLTFSSVVYTLSTLFVMVFASQISMFFANDPATASEFVPFVQIAAVSALGYGLSETWTGILKAAGDNDWVMYAQFVGKYLMLLPITYLGTVTPLGVIAVYVALVAETWSVAVVVGHRVTSGKWKTVSRIYPSRSVDD